MPAVLHSCVLILTILPAWVLCGDDWHDVEDHFSYNGTFEGCYSHESLNDAGHVMYSSQKGTNTPDICIAECLETHAVMVALFNGSGCGCLERDVSFSRHQVIGDALCGMPCPGDIYIFCGGTLAVSLYTISVTRSNMDGGDNRPSKPTNTAAEMTGALAYFTTWLAPAPAVGLLILGCAVIFLIRRVIKKRELRMAEDGGSVGAHEMSDQTSAQMVPDGSTSTTTSTEVAQTRASATDEEPGPKLSRGCAAMSRFCVTPKLTADITKNSGWFSYTSSKRRPSLPKRFPSFKSRSSLKKARGQLHPSSFSDRPKSPAQIAADKAFEFDSDGHAPMRSTEKDSPAGATAIPNTCNMYYTGWIPSRLGNSLRRSADGHDYEICI